DQAGPGLRGPGGGARLDGAGGGLGVDRVGLALAVASLAVRAVDLDHPVPGRGEVPGDARTPGAGALDPDRVDRAEPAEPGLEPAVALGCRRERLGPEQQAALVERRSDVTSRWVSMPPVTATAGSAMVEDAITCFSFSSRVGGWHAPAGGKRTRQ